MKFYNTTLLTFTNEQDGLSISGHHNEIYNGHYIMTNNSRDHPYFINSHITNTYLYFNSPEGEQRGWWILDSMLPNSKTKRLYE